MFLLPANPIYSPTNWYWTAQDKRVYSSARNMLVYVYDSGYLAFIAAVGGTTPWPVDANGQQTTAALQATVAQYGITLPFS